MQDPAKEAQKYIDHHTEMQATKRAALKDIHEVLVQSIEHSRNFYTQLTGFSLLVIAAVLQVLSSEKQTIIINKQLAVIGLVGFSISALSVIFYLSYIILNENKKLNQKKKFYITTTEEQTKKSLEFAKQGKDFSEYEKVYLEDGLKYVEQEKEMNESTFIDRQNYKISWLISLSFIFGFIFLSLSLFVLHSSG